MAVRNEGKKQKFLREMREFAESRTGSNKQKILRNNHFY